MRKILAGIMLVATWGMSCKKNSVNKYYLQADVNGVQESYDDNAFAQEYLGDITAAFSVYGKNTGLQQQLFISIGHTYNRIVTTGTYDKSSVDSLFFPGLSYTVNDTTIYGSGVHPENPYPISITISNLSNTTASGTFRGTVYNGNNPADSLVITNGKFYVPIKH